MPKFLIVKSWPSDTDVQIKPVSHPVVQLVMESWYHMEPAIQKNLT
jgi:hypothetical protein